MRDSKRPKSRYGYINGTEENIQQTPSYDPKLWTHFEKDYFRIEHAFPKIVPEQFPFEECENQKANDAVEVIKVIEYGFIILDYNSSTSSEVLIPDKKAQTLVNIY